MLNLADRVNSTFKSGIGRALLLSAAGVFMYAYGGDASPVNTPTSLPENNTTRFYRSTSFPRIFILHHERYFSL
jgi:hypothetical protein|tara:strand:+ start:180 stop:401 length:222 start_codon:yes stop_codon:yes gene_type:complete